MRFWHLFWTNLWALWLLMLIVADPIAMWMGNKYKVGDEFTDTHFLATHIPIAIRAGILGWLVYHFMVQHARG